jgi:polyisoprenoid-binding protein YceI
MAKAAFKLQNHSIMQKGIILSVLCAVLAAPASFFAQSTYFTKSAAVNFDATAKNSPEEIKASQTSGTFVMTSTGAVEAAVLIKSFLFKQALMQEHFNENYMESSKFPKATFKGKVKDGSTFNLGADGVYQVEVVGKMTMHGVTKDITAPAKITVAQGKVSVEADFSLVLADYGISVPGLVADKVAKIAKINIKGALAKK